MTQINKKNNILYIISNQIELYIMTQINKKNNILYIVSNQIELHITTQINKKNIFFLSHKNACNAGLNVLYYRHGKGNRTESGGGRKTYER